MSRGESRPFDVEGLLDDAAGTVPAATLRVLRRRRTARRLAAGVAAALLFGGGVLTGLGLAERQAAPPGRDDAPAPETPARVPPPTEEDPATFLDAAALTRGPRQVELLLRAGDLYLERRGAIEPALGCYERALALMGPDERAQVDRRGSWLLSALRLARE